MSTFTPHFDPKNIPDLTGKVAFVTGGNGGIGLETVYFLASNNAKVYMGARSEERATKSIESLQPRLKSLSKPVGDIIYHHLDLATINGSISSAKALLERESRLDIIVGNAGVSFAPWDKDTADGYEPQFATNHIGHFAFITTLLPLLEKTAAETHDVRVVMTSSEAHKFTKGIDYDTITNRPEKEVRGFGNMKQMFVMYGQSKLANMYFAQELDRRTGEGSNGIWVNSLHPGTIGQTNLGHGAGDFIPAPVVKFIRKASEYLSLSFAEGASNQTYLATSPQIPENKIHGRYFTTSFTWTARYKGPAEEIPAPHCTDPAEGKKLWDWTEEAVRKASAPKV